MPISEFIVLLFIIGCQTKQIKDSPGNYLDEPDRSKRTSYIFRPEEFHKSENTTLVAQHSQKCLNISSHKDGEDLTQQTCNGSPNQQFTLIMEDSQTVKIQSVYSGKCLDVKYKSTDDGARVHQWTCLDTESQKMKLNGRSYSQHTFGLQFGHSGKCLDIVEGSKDDGGKAHQWNCFDENFRSQSFYFDKMPDVLRNYEKVNLGIHVSFGSKPRPPVSEEQVNEFVARMEQSQLKKAGNIYFIFFDTLRWDMVQRFAPNISKFMADNLGGKLIACSAGTYHSTYAFMHSQPCQFMPDLVQNAGRDSNRQGALVFQALRKFGYEVEGIGEFVNCVNEVESSTWNKNLESYFGYESQLLHGCRGGTDFSKHIDPNEYSDGKVIDFAKTDVKSKSGQNTVYFLYLYSSHATYKWNRDINLVDNSIQFITFNDLFTQDQSVVKNGYINGVRTLDFEFGRFIDFLKSEGTYDSSTIVFVGDHGEMLGEKPNYQFFDRGLYLGTNGKGFNHETQIYRENIGTIVGYKFPKPIMDSLDLKMLRRKMKLYSPLDLVLTLFEGLGLKNFAKDYLRGKSVLSFNHKNSSAASYEAVFWGPSRYIALVSENHKVFLRFDVNNLDDYLNADSFTIIDITDLNDKSAYYDNTYGRFGIEGNGVVRDYNGLVKQIKTEFADALATIFQ